MNKFATKIKKASSSTKKAINTVPVYKKKIFNSTPRLRKHHLSLLKYLTIRR